MSRMEIVELRITETTPTQDMFMRPWTVRQSSVNNDSLIDLVTDNTSGGTNLSYTAVSTVANEIMVPKTETSFLANIGGSYADRRLSIAIYVKTVDTQMTTKYEIITGFTNYMGSSDLTGLGSISLDENMLVFVNGVSDLVSENFGGGTTWNVNNISQILSPVTGMSLFEGGGMGETMVNDNLVSSRPADVLSVMAGQVMSAGGSRTAVTGFSLKTDNRRSLRTNNIASSFLSRTMSSYRDNFIVHDSPEESSALINAAASPSVSDPANTASVFLRQLRDETNYRQERAVTLRDLMSLDPSFNWRDKNNPKVKYTQFKDSMVAAETSLAMDSANWNGAYKETVVAQMALSTFPAIMNLLKLGALDVEMHNATLDSSVDLKIYSMNPLRADINHQHLMNLAKIRLPSECFVPLHVAARCGVLRIRARVNLMGNAHFEIEIDGGTRFTHVAPVYNDASYSQCLATDLYQLQGLAAGLEPLCAAVTSRALGETENHEMMIQTPGHGMRTDALTAAPSAPAKPAGVFGGMIGSGNGGGFGF